MIPFCLVTIDCGRSAPSMACIDTTVADSQLSSDTSTSVLSEDAGSRTLSRYCKLSLFQAKVFIVACNTGLEWGMEFDFLNSHLYLGSGRSGMQSTPDQNSVHCSLASRHTC